MAKGSRFVYRGEERTSEDISRRAKQKSGSYDSIISGDVTKLKVPEGDNSLRIMPPYWTYIEDDKERREFCEKWGRGWEVPVWVHFNVGADGGAFLCLDKIKGEPCPICEARRESSDPDERDALMPTWRGLCWAINRNDEKAGPQIWEISARLFRDINGRSVDKKTGKPILIDDPEEGYDVLFNREGTTKNTQYTQVEIDRDPTPLHDDERQQDRWRDYTEQNPIHELLLFQDPVYLEKVLMGKVSRRQEAAESDGEPDGGRSNRRRVARDEGGGEEDRSSRRRSEPEPEPEPEQEQRHSRRSSRDDPPEPAGDDRIDRRSSRREAPQEPDDPPSDGRRGVARRRPREDAEQPSEGDQDPPQSREGRRGLEKLRQSRSRDD